MSGDTLRLPGLNALERERAARKAAERTARQWQEQAQLWEERAKRNGEHVRLFKEKYWRYKGLYEQYVLKNYTTSSKK